MIHKMYARKDVAGIIAAVVALGALGGCRDDMPVPDVPELEESETVQFLVRNNIDQWTAARTDGIDVPADWSDLQRMDSVCLPYPELFIRKDVYYARQNETLAPYMNPGKGEDPDKDFMYNYDDVEPYPGTTTYSLPLDVRGGDGDAFARLKVSAVAMTDESLGELRELGREARRRSAGAGSRTTIVDKDNVADWYSNIGVSAVCFDGTLGWGYRADLVKTMDNELVSRDGDRWKTTRGNYYWNVWGEDHNRVRFFAYAPYGTPGLTQSEDDADGTPRFAYTVAADVDEQVDLGGIAVTTPGNFHRTVPLRFDHILSGVRFLVDDSHMASCLKQVRVKGVHGSAIYKYSTEPYDFTDPDDPSNPNINPDNRPDKPGQTPGGQEPQKGVWTMTDAPNCTYTLHEDDFFGSAREPLLSEWSQEGGDEYWCVTDPDRMFMLMPQVLPDNATIEATFVDDGETIIMEGRIGGKDEDGTQREWLQGHIYTYVITTYDVEYVLKLVKKGGAYPYAGGFDDKTVVSYARYYDKNGNLRKIVPVEWTPIFYNKAGEEVPAPDWAKVIYDREPGRAKDYRPETVAHGAFTYKDAEEFAKLHEDSVCCGHVHVEEQYALFNDPHTKALRDAAPLGSEANPVNLAGIWNGDRTNTISTANSYVINAPGYYNIPLVYGNGIKGGAPNAKAWEHTMAVNANRPYSFLTHLGSHISDPYLKNTATISTAAIITTNIQHAVQLVHLSNDFLTIYVDSTYIGQGNTTVCVRDAGGNIMWSWHLWTTDYNPYKSTRAVPNRIGETYDFMEVNLGWVYPENADSDPKRAVYWKPAQQRRKSKYQSPEHEEDAGLYITKNRYRIIQDQYVASLSGYAPYYNWGRKDALLRTIHLPGNMPANEFGNTLIPYKYSYRWLFDNKELKSGGQSLRSGHWYYGQFSLDEAIRVPWAMETIYQLAHGDDFVYEGSTQVDYHITWWKGKYTEIHNVGSGLGAVPVPIKSGGTWPIGKFNGTGLSPFQTDYDNYLDLWCIGQNDESYLDEIDGSAAHQVIKSVYDPCPPGFMVPPNRAFDRLNSSTGDWIPIAGTKMSTYHFNEYQLDLPPMPFLSARIGGKGVNYTTRVPQWDMDEGFTRDGYLDYSYCMPMEESLYNNSTSLWTADVTGNWYGGHYYITGSIYNITLGFVTNPGAGIGANGPTAQESVDPRPASGFGWSISTRQIRPVKEE